MPARDGSGPQGMGSMTGRGMGPCGGSSAPGAGYGGWNVGRWGGRGGRGFGRRGGGFGMSGGFGWRSNAAVYNDPIEAPTMSRDQQVNWLKAQAEDLQSALRNITSRLDALQGPEEG